MPGTWMSRWAPGFHRGSGQPSGSCRTRRRVPGPSGIARRTASAMYCGMDRLLRPDLVPHAHRAADEDAAVEAGAVDHGVEDLLVQDLLDVAAGDGQARRLHQAGTDAEAPADQPVQRHAPGGDVAPMLLGQQLDLVVPRDGLEHFAFEQRDLAALLRLLGIVALLDAEHVAVAHDAAPRH